MPEPQENLISLIFLAGDLDAQRLAIAWPKASVGLTGRVDDHVNRNWAESSGLPLHVVARLGRVLVDHGICRLDGTTAPEAIAFVRSQIAAALKRRPRR